MTAASPEKPDTEPNEFIDPNLTYPDLLLLKNLLRDVEIAGDGDIRPNGEHKNDKNARGRRDENGRTHISPQSDKPTIEALEALNNPSHKDFEPTVFVTWDLSHLKTVPFLYRYIIQPYIRIARKLVRVEADVVMLTHLLLYFATSVPSAITLYWRFHWVHGILHWILQSYYVGTYTLMMHQHIHMGGILCKWLWWIDHLFPYITNPLMGHTWNSYYYHHVKHHHVEGNGPNDLSSTLRYQRDSILDFSCYVGRFFFLIWLELPLYFISKGQRLLGLKAGFWELANYLAIFLLFRYGNTKATVFVFLLPLIQLRVGLMTGNWGQHALVDDIDPTSDFRSSITLIDVASNRFCYNDGYHTSHHLNPRRHWRDHPVAVLKQKDRYSKEHALIFRNIDYIMMTIKLMQKDYRHLAKCLVPIGDQVGMSIDELAAMLQTKTRRFSEAEIQKKFGEN